MTVRCPYCGTDMIKGEAKILFCCTCGTGHHPECWEENGGCTVFGCASGPADEPKVNITPDLAPPGPAAFAQPTVRMPLPPPPPPAQLSFSGYNVAPPRYMPPPAAPYYNPAYPPMLIPPKSRVGYIMLGIFLGLFGVHNFYAGYWGKGIAQLCLTICSVFILSWATFIWALVEVCTVDRDSRGVPLN